MYSSLEPRAADVQQIIDEINRIAEGIKLSGINDIDIAQAAKISFSLINTTRKIIQLTVNVYMDLVCA